MTNQRPTPAQHAAHLDRVTDVIGRPPDLPLPVAEWWLETPHGPLDVSVDSIGSRAWVYLRFTDASARTWRSLDSPPALNHHSGKWNITPTGGDGYDDESRAAALTLSRRLTLAGYVPTPAASA